MFPKRLQTPCYETKESKRLHWLRSSLVKTLQALHRVHGPVRLLLNLLTCFAILLTHGMLGQPALLRFVSIPDV